MLRHHFGTPWPDMAGVEWLSSTVISSEDEMEGREVAEVLLERTVSLCQNLRTDFEDPEFGPDLSDEGQSLADEMLALLEEELPPGKFQAVARSVEARQRKGLGGPGGMDFLPKGPLEAVDLVWRSGNGGGTIIIKAADPVPPPSEDGVQTPEEPLPSPARTVMRKGSNVISPISVASYPVQGALGDRWLLGAMSLIADLRPRILRELFVQPPQSQADEAPDTDHLGPLALAPRNVYIVRLYHNFRWHFVMMDGRVPTHKRGKDPAFGRCSDPSETWVTLIEKAVAKLFGSYASLHMSGTLDTGMHLLTGCATHTIHACGVKASSLSKQGGEGKSHDINEQHSIIQAIRARLGEEGSPGRIQLFQQMKMYLDAGFLVSCQKYVPLEVGGNHCSDDKLGRASPTAPKSNFLEPNGILRGHSYTILDVAEIKPTGERMVRLTNPWHCGQYNGKWSAGSFDFSENREAIESAFPEIKRHDELGRLSQHAMALSISTPGRKDFLMSFDELIDTMSHISVGFVQPNDPKLWNISSITGEWKGAVGAGRNTAGGAPHPNITLTNWCKNPRFRIRVAEQEVSPQELERRKRSAVAPKIAPTSIVVALRQSTKSILGDTTVGMRFLNEGSPFITEKIPRAIPGMLQPPHISGTGSMSSAMRVKTPSAIDVVPDNFRVGASARFRISVICRGNNASINKTEAIRRDNKGSPLETKTKIRVFNDHDVASIQSLAENRDPFAIPEDRIPPIQSDSMQHYMRNRMIHRQIRLQEVQLSEPQQSKKMADKDASNKFQNEFKEASKSAAKSERSPPPSYASSIRMKNNVGVDTTHVLTSKPPPPAYTRRVVSPKLAELRSRVQTSLVENPEKLRTSTLSSRSQTASPVLIPEGAFCSVVFRGPLWMPTIDSAGVETKRFKYDDSTNKGDDSSQSTNPDPATFVLCTVQEIVQPYALVFTVEHPGTRYTDTRSFHLKDLETILQSPSVSSSKFDANLEAVEAIDNWIETGELPRHDHLATWLGSQMVLDLSGGGIRVAAIDGPIEDESDQDNLSHTEDLDVERIEYHDLSGADRDSIASSWDGTSAGEEEHDPFSDMNIQTGDENLPPGEWNTGRNMPERNEEKSHAHHDDFEDESPRAQLPPSDPFVLASLHAGATLQELQKMDEMRKRVAEVREEVIMQRARRLRAKSEYNREITRLQHEEVGKAIMAQQVAIGVEAKLLQGDVRDQRRKRELRRITNPFKHNPSDKWIKGPFLGEGPLPARVMDAPRRKARRDRESSKFVYDPHGRRVLRKKMGSISTGPPVEVALAKLRQAAMSNSAYYMDIRELFDKFDTEKNGFLSRKEMLAAIHSLGVKLTDEEAESLADHFDKNGNGTVHFSEFSFGFFNRRSLITKWRLARGPGMRSDASIMMKFRKYDVDGSGKLERDEFAKCLFEMGIRLSELELQILAAKFDENDDGYVQPKEFLTFMRNMMAEDNEMKEEQRKKHANSVLGEVRRIAKASEDPKHKDNARTLALQKKIKAQEAEIKRLEKFVETRLRSARK